MSDKSLNLTGTTIMPPNAVRCKCGHGYWSGDVETRKKCPKCGATKNLKDHNMAGTIFDEPQKTTPKPRTKRKPK